MVHENDNTLVMLYINLYIKHNNNPKTADWKYLVDNNFQVNEFVNWPGGGGFTGDWQNCVFKTPLY